MRGPLIEGLYPTSTDAGVTLPGVRRFVIIVAVALGLAYVIGVPAFLERDDDPLPPKADAIVVLAGSDNRLPAAEALFDGGLAPTLVVSADRSGHDAQRAAIADVRTVYEAQVAERRIMHQSTIAGVFDPAELEERESELRRDLDRFAREREERIKRIRAQRGAV